MAFKSTNISIVTTNGRHVKLLEPLVYETEAGEIITVPEGAESDGCSTPQFVWNLIPPFGTYWLAAVLHDYTYRQTSRSKNDCDSLFLEAMKSLGVDFLLREAIYEGVHLGGGWAFDDDRKPKLKAFAHHERMKLQQQNRASE